MSNSQRLNHTVPRAILSQCPTPRITQTRNLAWFIHHRRGGRLADMFGFVSLPPLYWLLLAIMLLCYVVLTQLVKTWFYRRFGE